MLLELEQTQKIDCLQKINSCTYRFNNECPMSNLLKLMHDEEPKPSSAEEKHMNALSLEIRMTTFD